MASQTHHMALGPAELNARALDEFIYERVTDDMIRYLAQAARDVIRCDESMMPPSPSTPTYYPNDTRLPITPPRTPPPVASGDKFLPTLEEFIYNLVWSSNVQVPTLMSTLVYLNRLRSRLQPEAKGLRCTAHRIFLAALILTAKYLNDSSPKNKHWARYTEIWDDSNGPRRDYKGRERPADFQFSRTEVNLMEKQLLMLLEWELRITKEDLCRELDLFLEPTRQKIVAQHEKQMRRAEAKALKAEEARRREEEARMAESWMRASVEQANANASAHAYATPPESPEHKYSHSRSSSRDTRYTADSVPSLDSSSRSRGRSTSSSPSYGYAPSLDGSIGATTPPSEVDTQDPYFYSSMAYNDSSYDPPVEIIVAQQQQAQKAPYYHHQELPALPQVPQLVKQKSLLPYEISPEELRELETGSGAKRSRVRGMFGRIFNSSGTGLAAAR